MKVLKHPLPDYKTICFWCVGWVALGLVLCAPLVQATNAPFAKLQQQIDTLNQKVNELSNNSNQNIINFSVKAFGAKGDGNDNVSAIQSETEAIKKAIEAANRASTSFDGRSGVGGIVYFPQGHYIVNESLMLAEGVSIQGEGISTAVIEIRTDIETDGLVWSSPTPYGRGGYLRDISIKSDYNVRDLVSLNNWGRFEMSNVLIQGSNRYGLSIATGINTTIRQTKIQNNRLAGVWIDSSKLITTTTRFIDCYFQNTLNGPGADVSGIGISFINSIFESNGEIEPDKGAGIRVRSGSASLFAPYFENNAWHDMWLGSDNKASITVVNPTLVRGGYALENKAGAFIDHVTSGSLIGGNYSAMPRSIVFTPNGHQVSVIGANVGVNIPEYTEDGKTINDYPGLIHFTNPRTGDPRISGRNELNLEGGGIIDAHRFATTQVGPMSLANDDHVEVRLTVPGSLPGDSVLVGFKPLLPGNAQVAPGVLAFGVVSFPNTVDVTVLNKRGIPIMLNNTLKVDVLRTSRISEM